MLPGLKGGTVSGGKASVQAIVKAEAMKARLTAFRIFPYIGYIPLAQISLSGVY
jgi:hypothetical protein